MRVLILGGTAEGAALAAACAARPELAVISSLAGRTVAPRPLAGAVRSGGFGGAAGLAAYLRAEGIERVVDATHPFAAKISAQAAAACAACGVPRLRLARPPWPQLPGDRWLAVPDLAAAADCLPTLGRRILVTTGQRDLACLILLPGLQLVVRTVEPPPAGVPLGVTWLCARGPFGLADELALLRRHTIEVVLTKASGGAATYGKIAAARALGLPVVMLQRPPPPPGPVATDLAAALAWLAGDGTSVPPAGGPPG